MSNNFEISKELLGKFRSPEINEHDYYMGMAMLTSLQSPDPSTRVGACYVKDNNVIACGFNQPPRNWELNDFPFERDNSLDEYETKYPYIVHAEIDGLTNINASGSTCYVTLFPCLSCARSMIHSGVKRIVYLHKNENNKEDLIVLYALRKCGVEIISYDSVKSKNLAGIDIDFNRNDKERIRTRKSSI